MANKKTFKQLKKAQKVSRQAAVAEYLNVLLSGQVETEEQMQRVNTLAKNHLTFSEATAISKILVAQLDYKLAQVMEKVRIQQIVLETLGATEEMFQEAEEQYERELAEVEKQLSGDTSPVAVPDEAGEPDGEVVPEEELEELKEALEANDADPREEE